MLGFTHCLPCQALGLACSLASRCPEYLAWQWAVTKWRCQPLGSLGVLQGWDLGVSPRVPWRALACWSGFWKTSCVEDTGIWGCEGLPGAWWDMGPGHQDTGGSVYIGLCLPVAGTWARLRGHPVGGGKGSLGGMQFEYLQQSTMKILGRKFSDKSETNRNKAIMC